MFRCASPHAAQWAADRAAVFFSLAFTSRRKSLRRSFFEKGPSQGRYIVGFRIWVLRGFSLEGFAGFLSSRWTRGMVWRVDGVVWRDGRDRRTKRSCTCQSRVQVLDFHVVAPVPAGCCGGHLGGRLVNRGVAEQRTRQPGVGCYSVALGHLTKQGSGERLDKMSCESKMPSHPRNIFTISCSSTCTLFFSFPLPSSSASRRLRKTIFVEVCI